MHFKEILSFFQFSFAHAAKQPPSRHQLIIRIKESSIEQHQNICFGEISLFSEACHSLFYHCKRTLPATSNPQCSLNSISA